MPTWVLGDIHGCAEELSELLGLLSLGPADLVVSVGDLFHRGPDPRGVAAILEEAGARFVLGNHDHAVLRRLGLAPDTVRGARSAPRGAVPFDLEEEDLLGDGRRPCRAGREQRGDLVAFLQRHSGYHLRRADLAGAGPTPDGREWTCVHAGVIPGLALEDHSVEDLLYQRRLDVRGRPWWYESYSGPDLVMFGHTPAPRPRMQRAGGRLVALGLDTGCVYGGALTAYSPELDQFASVPARRAYAQAS